MILLAATLALLASEPSDCTQPPAVLPPWTADEQIRKMLVAAWTIDEDVAREVLSPLEDHPEAGPYMEELGVQLRSDDLGVRERAESTVGAFHVYTAILALQQGGPTAREIAIGALSEIGSPAIPALSVCLQDGRSDHRLRALRALAYFGEDELEPAIPLVRDLLGDSSREIREAAREVLP